MPEALLLAPSDAVYEEALYALISSIWGYPMN